MKQTVMLIDDNPDLIFLQTILLETENFKVISASNPIEALKMLSYIEKPDLIIVDFNMDDMNGDEFISHIETNNPNLFNSTPILLTSSTHNLPLGKATGFIAKPMDIDEYIVKIKSYIKG